MASVFLSESSDLHCSSHLNLWSRHQQSHLTFSYTSRPCSFPRTCTQHPLPDPFSQFRSLLTLTCVEISWSPLDSRNGHAICSNATALLFRNSGPCMSTNPYKLYQAQRFYSLLSERDQELLCTPNLAWKLRSERLQCVTCKHMPEALA